MQRHNYGVCNANLSKRRMWFDDAPDGKKQETPVTPATPAPDNNADTGKQKGEETTKTVQMSQKDLDALFADRAGQAKSNAISDLLKTLGVSDVTALTTAMKSHNEAKEKRKADEEAAKSELQKKDDLLTASTTLQVTHLQTIKILRVENAIMRLAPAKEVPADRFMALLKLMDMDSIPITDGKIEDKDVETALDKTITDNPMLIIKSSNGQGYGSPSRKTSKQPQTPATPQPVTRNRKVSM